MRNHMRAMTISAFAAAVAAALTLNTVGMAAQGSSTAPKPGPVQAAPPKTGAKPATGSATTTPASGVAVPADYVIGPNDQLTIKVWRDDTLSGDVTVRPDGKITMLLLNDIQAAGLTPETLRQNIAKGLSNGNFKEDPVVTVVVKQINSRTVFITGQVAHPGPYPLLDHMTVSQLITIAGGVAEYAKSDKIGIFRRDNGQTVRIPFNYKSFSAGKTPKDLKQNIELKPGDQVIVP